MKKMFELLMMIFIILSTLTACEFDEKSESASTGENAESSITTVLNSNAPSNDIKETTVSDIYKENGSLTAQTTCGAKNTLTEINTAEEYEVSNEYTKKDDLNSSAILWVSINERELCWDFEQKVTVIDKNGNCFRSFYTESKDDDSKRFLLYDYGNENWYDDLLKITSLEKVGAISDESLELMFQLSENFDHYSSSSVIEYTNYIFDEGMSSLYGIYIDKNNEPKYVKLCSFGEVAECIDDKSIIEFINEINKSSSADKECIFGGLYDVEYNEENILQYVAR